MNQTLVFGGLYVLLVGGFLTAIHSVASSVGLTVGALAWTGGPLVTYGILILGVLVAIAATWARGR